MLAPNATLPHFLNVINVYFKNSKWIRLSVLIHKFKSQTFQLLQPYLIKKQVFIIPCGKCATCKLKKQYRLTNLVDHEYLHNKNVYFLTITFNDHNVDTFLDQQTKNQLIYFKESAPNDYEYKKRQSIISNHTTLSKIHICNIIRNFKKKAINNGNKLVHYFLSGEYGSNTKRAHYHLLLFFEKKLPLKVKSKHKKKNQIYYIYECDPIFKSKQYDQYFLEIANQNVGSYVSKYVSKETTNQDISYKNFNYYEERQIKQLIKQNLGEQNILNSFVIKNEKINQKINLFLFLIQTKLVDSSFIKTFVFNYNTMYIKLISKQKPFIKKSRKLGLHNYDLITLLSKNLINYYYLQKLKKIFNDLDSIFYQFVQLTNTTFKLAEINDLIMYYIYLLRIIEAHYLNSYNIYNLNRINFIKTKINILAYEQEPNNQKYSKIYEKNDIF